MTSTHSSDNSSKTQQFKQPFFCLWVKTMFQCLQHPSHHMDNVSQRQTDFYCSKAQIVSNHWGIWTQSVSLQSLFFLNNY